MEGGRFDDRVQIGILLPSLVACAIRACILISVEPAIVFFLHQPSLTQSDTEFMGDSCRQSAIRCIQQPEVFHALI